MHWDMMHNKKIARFFMERKPIVLPMLIFCITAIVVGVYISTRTDSPTEQRAHAAYPPGTISDRAKRVKIMQDALNIGTQEFETDDLNPSAIISPETMAYGALAEIYLYGLYPGRDIEKGQQALQYLVADQDMNASSPTYGEIPFTLNSPSSVGKNNNSNSFVPVGIILNGYSAKLSFSFESSFRPHVVAMLSAIKRLNSNWPYKEQDIANYVLLGQYLNDATTVAQGSQKLDGLIAEIKRRGISEYTSPGYYATTLVALNAGYMYAKDATIKAKFKTLHDFYWEEIMANYFIGNKSFSGPNSRSYAWDFNATGMDYTMFAEGIGRLDSSPNIGKLHPFIGAVQTLNAEEAGYHPDSSIMSLGTISTKGVKSKWDTLPGADRYNYITSDVTLGASSRDYSVNKQDRTFSAELANVSLLRMSQVTDGKNRRYGKIDHTSPIGQSGTKDFYLSHPVAVQEQGNLLYLSNVQPASRTECRRRAVCECTRHLDASR
jgi:hypothetical protein